MGIPWTFVDFDETEPERGHRLRSAPPWPELVSGVRLALRGAIEAGDVRFGQDESSRDSQHLRGVVQFPLGHTLFDWLFNAETGYRAQFRAGPENGLAKNAQLISELCRELLLSSDSEIVIHRLTSEFTYKEPISGCVSQIASSLDPRLSKVWPCEKLIGQTGQIHDVFVSRTGPRLVFDETDYWSSLYPETGNGWLDVKGAFMGSMGLYQPKPPEERATKLAARGTA